MKLIGIGMDALDEIPDLTVRDGPRSKHDLDAGGIQIRFEPVGMLDPAA